MFKPTPEPIDHRHHQAFPQAPSGPPSQLCAVLCERLCRAHRLWSHPLLERCRNQTLSTREILVLAPQLYRFSRSFPRFLATVLRTCTDEPTQQVVAERLWDEMGRGNPSRSHAELYRSFTRALGIDDTQLEMTRANPETIALIETYLDMPQSRGVVGALAAICYASESIVGPLYTVLHSGLAHHAGLPPEALEFFALHVQADDGSKTKLQQVLARHIRSRSDVRMAANAMLEALDARVGFLDGIMRKAQSRP